jgi:serine/threonine protein kinase
MGALYLAVTGDRGLEKQLVIKTVLPHLADSEYVARFRDEAKVVVKLSHGNLVPVFDAGQVGGEIFLAMDYIEGKDLRAVWNRCAKKGVAFPTDVAAYIVKELCRGLAYAHAFGELHLIHRDVSPPNVLISYSGEVKLTDFGLASSTLKLEKTAPGVIYGKVSYMSPEQARGEPLDGRTDLYAAGIILWELLTGRQLFPPGDGQPQDLLSRAKDPHPEPPSRRAPRVPPQLDQIVLRALAADPVLRFQTGEEMRAALAGWLAQEAPATDAARVEKFVHGLFAEDIARDRADREALVAKTRDRLKTIPPSDIGRAATVADSGKVRKQPPQTQRGIAVVGESGSVDVNVNSGGLGSGASTNAGRGGSGGVPGSGGMAATAAQLRESDAIGQVLDGRYRVRALIGEGGMGRVYEAEHVEIGRRVAVKILNPVYTRTPDVVARFRREARAASKIGHPNIVDVTDSGTTADGSVYFVMEYLEGVELAAVISREGALDISRALHVGSQICRALAAAHSAGIIHRDLKPENVFLIVREGTADFVKVLDFGIAKSAEIEEARTEKLTHPGMAMGTPEYMAPEQAAGRPADARSDVYAVGAILYEMVTGVPPYDGENFMEILTKKATSEPPPPRTLRPSLSESIEAVIMRAMARDPAARPASMEALEYELTKCLSGRGVAVAKMLGMPIDNSQANEVGDPASGSNRSSSRPRTKTDRIAASKSEPIERGGRSWLLWAGLGVVGVGIALAGYMVLKPPDRPEVAEGTKPANAAVATAPSGPAVAPSPGPGPAVAPSPGPGPNEPVPVAPTGPEAAAVNPPNPASQPAVAPVDAAGTPEVAHVEPKPENPRPENPKPEANAQRPENPKPIPPRPDPSRDTGPPHDAKEAEKMLADAKTATSEMEWPKARSLYDRVTRGKFHRADGLLGLANVAWQQGSTDEAIRFAKASVDSGGGNQARLMLGHAYLQKGLLDDAIAQYKGVLKDDPENKQAQKALKEAQRQKGD